MNDKIVDIFKDKSLVNKIQNKLPKLFHIAELESSRAGKIGMEVGAKVIWTMDAKKAR